MAYRHRVLLLLFSLSMLTFLDRVCISVAGPRMQDEMAISPQQWGWIVGIFAFAYAAFEIPSGMLGDMLGPRPLLTRITLWWSGFTALTSVCRGFGELLVVRFLFGVGEAGAYPNCTVCIARWFPLAERGFAQGVVFMASRLGGALTPFLVLPLQRLYGWRAPFLVFGGLGLLWVAAWHRWYRDPPTFERTHHGPLAAQVLGNASLRSLMAMSFTYHYGAFFFLSWLPTYLVKARGFTEAGAMLSSLPFVLGAAANGLGGLLTDRLVAMHGLGWGRRLSGMLGLGTAAFCMAAAILTPDARLALAFLSLCYGGLELIVPTNWAVSLDLGGQQAGLVSACMNTAGQMGGFVSSVAFGYLVGSGGHYGRAMAPMAVLMAVGALLWLRIDASRPIFPESSELITEPAAQNQYDGGEEIERET